MLSCMVKLLAEKWMHACIHGLQQKWSLPYAYKSGLSGLILAENLPKMCLTPAIIKIV